MFLFDTTNSHLDTPINLLRIILNDNSLLLAFLKPPLGLPSTSTLTNYLIMMLRPYETEYVVYNQIFTLISRGLTP